MRLGLDKLVGHINLSCGEIRTLVVYFGILIPQKLLGVGVISKNQAIRDGNLGPSVFQGPPNLTEAVRNH